MSSYHPPETPEEKLFCRRVADAADRFWSFGRVQFLGFLDERQQTLAEAQLGRGDPPYLFFGGYPQAERRMLAVGTEQILETEYPFFCLRIDCKKAGRLAHRDYLGALMGLGLKREAVGDILPDSGGAVLFALPAAAALIEEQLREVGRETVSARRCAIPNDLCSSAGEPVRLSVASLRLDAVLAALLHQSREHASELVRSDRVQINHRLCASGAAPLEAGDLITVRGTGRFRIEEIGGQSKKGRVFVTCIKY